MKAIGLDIGTSTICASLMDGNSKSLLETQSVPNDAQIVSAHVWERLQDPKRILELCQKLISSFFTQYQDITAIGITGQMHGVLFLNKQGTPVTPLYSWQDQRGELPYQGTDSYSAFLSSLTGYPLSTGYGMTTWFYLSVNRLLPKEAAVFCTIADYIAMSLAGNTSPLLHPSMAASLGMYSLSKKNFDLTAIQKAGLNIGMLPQLSTQEQPIGKYQDAAWISPALGDNQASFLGSVQGNSTVLVNVGTGGQISALCAYPEQIEESERALEQASSTEDAHSCLEFRPYLGDTLLVVGSALCSGYSYSMLKRFLEEVIQTFGGECPSDIYSVMNETAAAIYPSADTPLVDTRFHGTRSNPSLKGSITNINSNNFTLPQLILAFLQGICSELYSFYCKLPSECCGENVLTGSGNGIRCNPLLQKIFKDTFRMDLKIPPHTEEASFGSALFSLRCMENFLISAPMFFQKNRVFRVYTGGKLFDDFLHDGSRDSFYPEEWIASHVSALNQNSHDPKEGISRTKEGGLPLDDLIKKYPRQILGKKSEMGILVKYLDSAVRLPFQVHPDKEFSRRHFHSLHGKEECWIVLNTRPGACVYFGFQEGVTREILDKTIEDSLTKPEAIAGLLQQHEVVPGDVIFIPARTVHAIGAGCLILEVQEPTDFTIQPEPMCGNYRLSEYEMYLDLDRETAMQCFSYDPVKQVKVQPVMLCHQEDLQVEALIGPEQTDSFRINRIHLKKGRYTLSQEAGVYCLIKGEGEIRGLRYHREISQGDYFLLPAEAAGKYEFYGNEATLIECYSAASS